ncbi:hypothetical protein DXG01_000655 [Tephrocybe rancida]|nr:hypothetical protein DXG01_000655 [Tephrocybe rancida]
MLSRRKLMVSFGYDGYGMKTALDIMEQPADIALQLPKAAIGSAGSVFGVVQDKAGCRDYDESKSVC